MKKVKILGKMIPVFVLVLLGIGMVSATLLTYFGVLKTTVIVEQSVLVNDLNVNTGSLTILDDGEVHTLKNNGGVIAPIKFETTCFGKDGKGNTLNCNEITTSYVGVLELTTKTVVYGETPWVANGDAKATIHYSLTGDVFSWELIDSTIDLSGYKLIYYKDNSERFDNPASAILVHELAGDLPYSTDGNVDEYNYCGTDVSKVEGLTGDDYAHCHGAKLWLVPNECAVSDGTNYVINWDLSCADRYLFETDLVAYSKNAEEKLNLPANGGGVNFQIVNEVDPMMWPGTYTITTTVVPTE